MISVYSDGASGNRNGKPGGYGWVIVRDGRPVLAGYGGETATSNQRQELTGAIMGLEACVRNKLHTDERVELVSDSEYVLNLANGRFNAHANVDLVTRLLLVARSISGLKTRWVKGHSGDTWNERCDSLAGKGKAEAVERAKNGT